MVHSFKIDNENLIYDIETGSLFNVDELTFKLVNEMKGEKQDLSAYKQEEIDEAKAEIDYLVKEGVLFSKEEDITASTYSNEIKALCLHICHDCNLRCKYCFADTGAYMGKREYMSYEVGKNAIDFLIEKSGTRHNLEVDFFGGEPLMNFDVVKQIVNYANKRAEETGKFFKFTTTTNCVLLNDEIIDYLNETMDNVVLSLDGRKEVNDAVRKTVNGKGSYDIIIENIKKFAERRGDKSYYIRGTFTKNNLDFYNDVIFMNDLGFEQLSIEPVVLDEKSPLAIHEEDLPEIFENYEKLAVEYVKRRQTDKWFNFFHFYLDLNHGPCLKKRLMGCGAGNEYLAVTPSGEIYPCHQFADKKDYLMGNVFDKTLNMDIKKTFANSNLTTKPDCSSCVAKYHCSGGCSANNITHSGDINKPYKLACEMMRKRFECSLYIYNKEHKGE